MTSRDFCYWLQGYFEITEIGDNGMSLTGNQVKMIQKHLSLVFKHEIDPSMGDQKHQSELNNIHNHDYNEEDVYNYWIKIYGPCPHPGWKVSIHGWYDPEEGVPRC